MGKRILILDFSVTADIPYPPCLSIRVYNPSTHKSTEGFRRIGVGVLRRSSVDLYSNNPYSLLSLRLLAKASDFMQSAFIKAAD